VTSGEPPPRQFQNAFPELYTCLSIYIYREWGEALASSVWLSAILSAFTTPRNPSGMGWTAPRGQVGLAGRPLLGRPEGRAVPEQGFQASSGGRIHTALCPQPQVLICSSCQGNGPCCLQPMQLIRSGSSRTRCCHPLPLPHRFGAAGH
jgi:hypothetical protein